MYDAPGIGLAAIQVGVPLRVLVIDLQPEDPDAEPEVCTAMAATTTPPADQEGTAGLHQPGDPRSLGRDFRPIQEGCLSVPGSMPMSIARPLPRALAGP
jgi:peptide deformylase